LPENKKTTKYKFVASCLEVDLNLCSEPLVLLNGMRTRLIRDLVRLQQLQHLELDLLRQLDNATPVVAKALDEVRIEPLKNWANIYLL